MVDLVCPACRIDLKKIGVRIPISGYRIGTYINWLPDEFPNGVFDAGELDIDDVETTDEPILCGKCGIDLRFYLKDMDVGVME